MRLLAFSDLHRDLDRAARLCEMAPDADVVIGAGDFASVHQGLEEAISALSGIETPTVLVPGNNETETELRTVASDLWPAATVLHGEGTEISGQAFFGLGGGVPTTPWEWSFDLSEQEAADALAPAPDGAVLVVHSPPRGYCDTTADGTHLGSTAIFEAIGRTAPKLVVCGHIHEAWGLTAQTGTTEIANLGPDGRWFEI